MGKTYLVTVEQSLLTGAVGIASDRAKRETPPLDAPEDLLLLRRVVLASLADALARESGGGGSNVIAKANAALLDPGPGDRDGAPSGIEILEGVGALIVDEDAVDVAALAEVYGLEVLPDFDLTLPAPPVVASAAGAGDHWHLDQIGLSPGEPGGEGVLIGVLDTGIDAAHPEFAGKTVHFAEFDIAGNEISNTARDADEHGTHVSSIAAGRRCGVAPDADLAVAAVLTTPTRQGISGSPPQIAKGLNWLVTGRFRDGTPGVDVVNASLVAPGYNSRLRSPMLNVLGLGVPIIAAAGNDGRFGEGHHSSPGNFPEVLCVGASDHGDTVADFSDWGVDAPPAGPAYPLPDLCAPGVAVYAARPGKDYKPDSGTSMAAPVVTGVAARRIAANPHLRRRPAALFLDLKSRLAPVTPHRFGNRGGAGRIIA